MIGNSFFHVGFHVCKRARQTRLATNHDDVAAIKPSISQRLLCQRSQASFQPISDYSVTDFFSHCIADPEVWHIILTAMHYNKAARQR